MAAKVIEHQATIRWTRGDADFVSGKYSREHTWSFDGGATIPASPSPHIVAAPWSNAASVDPEEAFVAAVASCHMLTFLGLASRAGFQAESYNDEAVGLMTLNERGVPWINSITLYPHIEWIGERQPTAVEIERLHHQAHQECLIANSIKTNVTVE